jgi:hypothetical protein
VTRRRFNFIAFRIAKPCEYPGFLGVCGKVKYYTPITTARIPVKVTIRKVVLTSDTTFPFFIVAIKLTPSATQIGKKIF